MPTIDSSCLADMEEVGDGVAEATEEATATRVAASTTGDRMMAASADFQAEVFGDTMTGREEAVVVGMHREAASTTETGIPACHLAWSASARTLCSHRRPEETH